MASYNTKENLCRHQYSRAAILKFEKVHISNAYICQVQLSKKSYRNIFNTVVTHFDDSLKILYFSIVVLSAILDLPLLI